MEPKFYDDLHHTIRITQYKMHFWEIFDLGLGEKMTSNLTSQHNSFSSALLDWHMYTTLHMLDAQEHDATKYS